MKRFIILTICLVFLLGAGNAMAKTYNFDMANEYAPTSIHGENDTFFIETLERLSGGQIKITHHPGASLG